MVESLMLTEGEEFGKLRIWKEAHDRGTSQATTNEYPKVKDHLLLWFQGYHNRAELQTCAYGTVNTCCLLQRQDSILPMHVNRAGTEEEAAVWCPYVHDSKITSAMT